MDFALTPEQEQFAREFNEYLDKHLTPEVRAESEIFMNMNKDTDPGEFERGEYGGPKSKAFIRQMGADGWLGVGWPKEYGGQGRSLMEQHIFYETIWARRAPFPVLTLNAVGPTIMKFGSEEQKKEFLPRILKGDLEVAIGYTEPDAGTDLASLKTTAVRDGDSYVLNGNKVFTSIAHMADYFWVAVRTDPDPKKKHKGLSILLIDVDTPGVSIDPIYTMGGHRVNSVYLKNVVVPRTCLVGEENKGWSLIVAQLEHERFSLFSFLADEAADRRDHRVGKGDARRWRTGHRSPRGQGEAGRAPGGRGHTPATQLPGRRQHDQGQDVVGGVVGGQGVRKRADHPDQQRPPGHHGALRPAPAG